MPYHYRAHNGFIVVTDDRLEINRSAAAATSIGLDSQRQVIFLAAITDFVHQRPAILTHGYLRLATNGRTARPLSVAEANTHPDAITFTYGQRADFDKLVGDLHQIVSTNQAGGTPDPRASAQQGVPLAAISQIPRTDQEIADVIAYRPSHWEYTLFAGLLLAGMSGLADKWHDHEFRYARKTTSLEDLQEVASFLSGAMSRMSAMAESIGTLLTDRNNTLAFGPPGTPGDPNRIRVLAARLIEVYEGFLDWAAEVRSISTSDDLRETFEIAAELAEEPVLNIRHFIEQTAFDIERIIYLSEHEPVEGGHSLTLTLTLTVDPGLMADLHNSIERIKMRLKS